MARAMYKNRGFTLIELMVTIAVLAIIATIAAPSMTQVIHSNRLSSNAQSLALVLKNARSQAQLYRQDITVKVNSRDSDTTTTLNWQPKDNIRYKTSPGDIVFKRDGHLLARTTDLSLILCTANLDQSRTITISYVGIIEVSGEQNSC